MNIREKIIIYNKYNKYIFNVRRVFRHLNCPIMGRFRFGPFKMLNVSKMLNMSKKI